MTLFLQFIALLIGLVMVGVFGKKGFFVNLAIGLFILFGNKIVSLNQVLILIISAVGLYLLAEYINNIARKTYDPFPIREMILGGSALSILAGMVLRPIFSGAVLGPILGVPLLRRLTKLGYKAILLTFGSFILRFLYSLILNIYIIFKLLKTA